ncbi:MAG: hypothetical protein ABIO98_12200, partial [Chitinophagales bacterium]
MKKYIFIITFLFAGCKPDEPTYNWPIDPPDYFTDVKVNSESITFGIYLFEYEDTLISMSMNYSSDDAIYWT